ncbi:MAG: hypothetical protein GW903_00745 [Alphaproteobacteria bacterium]|nr:hypothetical protein [Alphaproteobacteria bacterium]NCQ87497.1 hypothetical protein [Alphaproteobacteria bacterium]NCT06368.1 hypothetical protein [Alphaproteobacteria bacterium]
MGSLTKRPKVPTAPQPVVIAPSVQAPVDTGLSEDDERAQVRQESLLRRSRGRLGTVFTGFQGLLSEVSTADTTARKTLLGE